MTSRSDQSSIAGPILLSGVGKSFDGRSQVVDVLAAIDLHITAGEIVSIIGKSGSGKSTLLRLIGGLLPPDAGQILCGEFTSEEARRKNAFALMPQQPALLPWRTALQNVALAGEVGGSKASAIDAADALERVGLAGFAGAMPHELSGGMQQRVSMARAFATRAPTILLDEPFAALDETTRELLHAELLALWNGGDRTVVMVTHNVSEAVLLSDRVIVLAGSPGRVVDEIRLSGERPRVDAFYRGRYGTEVARLRRALGANGKGGSSSLEASNGE